MNTLPDPESIGNVQAAEILLARGWEIYPGALPYGEFFIIPRTDGKHYHQVACLAYRTFYEQSQAQIPLQLSLFADGPSDTIGSR